MSVELLEFVVQTGLGVGVECEVGECTNCKNKISEKSKVLVLIN